MKILINVLVQGGVCVCVHVFVCVCGCVLCVLCVCQICQVSLSGYVLGCSTIRDNVT